MEGPPHAQKDLFFKDFINPIDQNRLSKVAEDEEACSLVSKCIRIGRFVPLSPEKLPESSEKVDCPEPVPKFRDEMISSEEIEEVEKSSKTVQIPTSTDLLLMENEAINASRVPSSHVSASFRGRACQPDHLVGVRGSFPKSQKLC